MRKWQRDEEGRVYRQQTRFGKRYYVHPDGKRIDDVWDITLASRSHERLLYPTQKPEALLERVIALASQPGDLVADFFAGSGTTLAVADRLGRRWIGCDDSPAAIGTIRSRLLGQAAAFDLLEAPGARRGWSLGESDESPCLEARVERTGTQWVVQLCDLTGSQGWPAAVQDWHDALEEWAVDWDYDGAVFRPAFSAQRRRGDRRLALVSAPVSLPAPSRRVHVRAIDCFGRSCHWETELEMEGRQKQ